MSERTRRARPTRPSRGEPVAVVLRPRPLPPEAEARIRSVMAWEDAGTDGDFLIRDDRKARR